MAFPASNWFRKLLEDSLENTAAIDLNADTIKTALYTNASVASFNYDSDIGYSTTVAPWSTAEVAAGGVYSTGGVTLATPTVAVSSGVVTFDAGDAIWLASTITARGCLVYDDTLTAGSKYGIVAVNFGSDFASTAGTFTVAWNASGILTFT